jgi:hypothetical protein
MGKIALAVAGLVGLVLSPKGVSIIPAHAYK